jgi:small glutamine-rich tetratricopeptide repeat-containing protein alpha
MSTVDRTLQCLVLDYIESKKSDVSDPDGLDVAIQCLSEAFGIHPSDRSLTRTIAKQTTLLDIFRNSTVGTASDKVVSESSTEKSTSNTSTNESSSSTSNDEDGAEAAKSRGNDLVAKGRHADAVTCYSEAIRLAPNGRNIHIYYANRAASKTEILDFVGAEMDARAAIKAKPDFAKAYNRLGTALHGQGKSAEAIKAYDEALEKDPSNDFARSRRRELQDKLDKAAKKGSNSTKSNAGAGMPGGMPGMPGGMPAGLEGLMGNPMLSQMMKNPAVMQAAQKMMSDPKAMQNMMSMLGGMGGAGGAGGLASMMAGMGGMGGANAGAGAAPADLEDDVAECD